MTNRQTEPVALPSPCRR